MTPRMDLMGPPPPSDPLGPPPESLIELIAEARSVWFDELWIPIDQSRPPITRGGSNPHDYYWQEEPASVLGRTISSSMLRLLGHTEGAGDGFSVLRAERAVRDMCAKQHRIAAGHSWPDGTQRALCAELYRGAVLHRLNLPGLLMLTGVPSLTARKFLKQAVTCAWEARREWLIYAVKERRLEDQSRS